ncbi:efflux RND transporter periplasmic adaptor subunit [Ignatzschineria rhizosphaerae]|uniref:Efflux RND transporter periplasmic adaptor subunit n=1 Tax=Ignatzschineria rhizosphaerae TaxID=2923279 RepID=A0ABY3X363_9GAMM|nr:efflux RND transporter periplasmic adaptor subunit [Ignatzschineria rhizosphaerae]UNM96139.1 efflux RND transporter periplasmic adaptor subunit [Ignatzschineria rhizosphaerae]
MQNIKKTVAIIIGIIILLVGTLVYISRHKPELVIQGEVAANRVDISVRVQGRATVLTADIGDKVQKGDLLLQLESPALETQLATSEAQYKVAIANRDVTYSTRPETIEAMRAQYEKAEADLLLAKSNLDRMEGAAPRGGVSQQNLDVARNSFSSAMEAAAGAKANYELAVSGSSSEQKKLADAQVDQALAALNQVKSDYAALTVKAPSNGQVTVRVAEVGQLYNPGTPLYSIVDMDNLWLTFNIREDYLNYAAVGDIFSIYVPALKAHVDVKIQAINPLGQFANWHATKATGDFDLRTFEVRAKPIKEDAGLLPGMSVIADWKSRRHSE